MRHPGWHVTAYVINWSSVVINPIIYVVSQKKYQVCLMIVFLANSVQLITYFLSGCNHAHKE